MTRSLTTRRRALQQFCVFAGGALFGIGNPADGLSAGLEANLPGDLADAVRTLVRHPASAAVIGETYLSQYRSERSADRLTQHLLKAVAGHHAIDETVLLDRIREDFARAEVVTLNGWLLSRTEARICALYAI